MLYEVSTRSVLPFTGNNSNSVVMPEWYVITSYSIHYTKLYDDGINLVRHGGGADFAFDGFLPEIGHGNVGPEIPVQVDENGVPAGQGVEQFRHVVMRFDLGGKKVLV